MTAWGRRLATTSTSSPMNMTTRLFLALGFGLLASYGVNSNTVRTGLARSGPEEMTVSHLMEQVRGDAIHWNTKGETSGYWDSYHHRNYKRACKTFAIQELGRRGSDSVEAVPELIRLFEEHDDWNSGDGIMAYRSDIARTLGAIDDPAAIVPMINLIREKSSSPDTAPRRGAMRWHDETARNTMYFGYGYGPDGITQGLKLFSEKHHPEILNQLTDLESELEAVALPNEWTKRAVADAIKFLRSRSSRKRSQVESIKLTFDLDAVEWDEKLAWQKEFAKKNRH